MAEYYIAPKSSFDATADAIREKTGSQSTIEWTEDGFADAIEEIGGDSREDLTVPRDVDFIDFDGRLLYSYTAQEFLALEELPANPSYPGLTAQGWNWTLSNAKEYVGQWGALVVGQNYTTDDGRTRAYLHITQQQVDFAFPLQLYINARTAGGGTIYWGDGETSTINSTTGGKTFTHTYNTAGDYKIEIEITSGTFSLGYHGSWQNFIGGAANNNNTYGRLNGSVYKIEIGDGFTGFGRQPFAWNFYLESISIPTNIQGFNDTASPDVGCFTSDLLRGVVFPSGFQGKSAGMFTSYGCNLKYISVPKSVTSFSIVNTGSCFHALRKLTLPSISDATPNIKLGYVRYAFTHFVFPGTYTTLSDATLESSFIKKLTIPETVTQLNGDTYIYNYYLEEIHVLPTAVPTMASTRALQGIQSGCVIYVPYSEDHSILEAYQTATNWSTFASYMQEEPQ